MRKVARLRSRRAYILGMMEKPSPLIAEFLGTFIFTFVVGCNGLSAASSTWTPTVAALVLMAFTYGCSEISGAFFNPAVNLSAALCRKLPWTRAATYTVVQLCAGILAGFASDSLHSQHRVAFAPSGVWWVCMIVEAVYTAVLAFVFLNVRASSRNNPTDNSNQFHGLAIACAVLAGTTVARDTSGGMFNPAVAVGLDMSGYQFGVYWGFIYTSWQIIGACIAALLFRLVRPEEQNDKAAEHVHQTWPTLPTMLACEFVGTFSIMLTAALGVLMQTSAVAWAVAAMLMSMSYALSDISGGHFNPAVTSAVTLYGRHTCGPKQAAGYICFQCIAGMLAALLATGLRDGQAFSLQPKDPFTRKSIFTVELIFTYLLVLVYLGTVTTSGIPTVVGRNFYFGLAMSMAVMSGTFIGSSLSGSGWLNPAMSLGVAVANTLQSGGFYMMSCDVVAEMLAAGLATLTFFATHGDHHLAKPKPV